MAMADAHRNAVAIAGAVLAATALTACGGSGGSGGAATAAAHGKPLQGRPNVLGTGDHGTKPAPPEGQSASGPVTHPVAGTSQAQAGAASPCGLVHRREAQAIFGRSARAPFEAPQGPTCIYRTKAAGGFVTLAVQSLDFKRASARIRERRRVAVTGHPGYCGNLGQSLLYVSVGDGYVLSVSGPCAMAKRFAAKALPRL